MIKITNIGGLMILIYTWSQSWTISKTSGWVSQFVVDIIEWLPSYMISTIFLGVTILYIVSLLTKELSKTVYILSLFLLILISKITVDILLLEDQTTTVAFIIHHKVPISMKLYYFKAEVMDALMVSPEILGNRVNLQAFHNTLENFVDINMISQMNAKEIQEYTCKIFSEYHNNQYSRQMNFIHTITLVGLCSILSRIF